MPPKKQQVTICNQKLFDRLSADVVCDTSHLSIESVLDSLYLYGQLHGDCFQEKFFPKQNGVKSRVVSHPKKIKGSHSGISPVTERYRTSSADRRFGSRNITSGRDILEEVAGDVRRKSASSRQQQQQQQTPQSTCARAHSSRTNPTAGPDGRSNTVRVGGFLGVTPSGSAGAESSAAGCLLKGITGSPIQPQFAAIVVVCDRAVSLGIYPNAVEAAKARDRALIRATGPSHCADCDLNFDVELYSNDPLERFSEHDGALKRQLFGSSWMGPRPCDFGFLIARAKENKLGAAKAGRGGGALDRVSAAPSASPSQNGATGEELSSPRNRKRGKGPGLGYFREGHEDDDEPHFKSARSDPSKRRCSVRDGDTGGSGGRASLAERGSSELSGEEEDEDDEEEEEEPPPPPPRIGSVIEVLSVGSGEVLRGVMLERKPGGGWLRVGLSGGDTKFHRGPMVWMFPPRDAAAATAGPVAAMSKEKLIRCVPASETSEIDQQLASLFSVALLYAAQPQSALGSNDPPVPDLLVSADTAADGTENVGAFVGRTADLESPPTSVETALSAAQQQRVVVTTVLEAAQQRQANQADQDQCAEMDATEGGDGGGGHHIGRPSCELSDDVATPGDGSAPVAGDHTSYERVDCATDSDSGAAVDCHHPQWVEVAAPLMNTGTAASAVVATVHRDTPIGVNNASFSLPSFRSVFPEEEEEEEEEEDASGRNVDGVAGGGDSVVDSICPVDAVGAAAVESPLVEAADDSDTDDGIRDHSAPSLAVTGGNGGEQLAPPSAEEDSACTPSPVSTEPDQPTLAVAVAINEFTGGGSAVSVSVGEPATCASVDVPAVTIDSTEGAAVVTPPRAVEVGAGEAVDVDGDGDEDEEYCYWVAESSDCESEPLADSSMALELIGRAPHTSSSSREKKQTATVTAVRLEGGEVASGRVSGDGCAVLEESECFTIGITVESVAAVLVAAASQQNVDIYASAKSAITSTGNQTAIQPKRQSNGRFTRTQN